MTLFPIRPRALANWLTTSMVVFACVAGGNASLSASDLAQSPASNTSAAGLRALDRQLMTTILDAIARSATLRALDARVRESQTVVYVSRAVLPPGTSGRTRVTAAVNGWRYLAIEVDCRLARIDMMAIVGHELQHATEIARDPDATDAASVAALYDRIGMKRSYANDPTPLYETVEAAEAGWRVRGELIAAKW